MKKLNIEDNVCNDCDYFDVMTGYCSYDKHGHHPLEEPCDNFVSWEDEHD